VAGRSRRSSGWSKRLLTSDAMQSRGRQSTDEKHSRRCRAGC
jgi:hypothetical protein